MLNQIITYLQNNTTCCELTELSQQAIGFCLNHRTLCIFVLAIIITGVAHDILVSLFTARIYFINSQGEKKHLADTMVLRGLDGYRLKIPGSVLQDVDIPMYHIEFKRLLVSRYKNRSIVVECEGFKKDLPMECSMDFVL